MDDYYQILELKEDCKKDEIKKIIINYQKNITLTNTMVKMNILKK